MAAQNAVTFAHLDTLPLREHLKQRLTELWDYPRTSLPVDRERPPVLREEHRPAAAVADLRPHRRLRSARAGARSQPAVAGRIDLGLRNSRPRPMPGLSPTRSPKAAPIGKRCASAMSRPARTSATSSRGCAFRKSSWTHDSKGFFYSRYPEPPQQQGARSGARRPGDLLPPPRHAAVGRRADLPAAGSPVVDRQRARSATTAATSVHPHVSRRRQQQSAALHRSRHRRDRRKVDGDDQADRRDASTPNTRRSATTSRASICAATRTRPTAASSRSISSTRSERVEGRGARAAARRSSTPRSSAAASSCISSSTCRAGCRCSRSTAAPQAKSRCRASARSRNSTGAADHYEIWFTFSSPLSPATVYRYDLESRRSIAFEAAPPPIDASQFETHAMFATSKDGTRVPFFLTGKKGVQA